MTIPSSAHSPIIVNFSRWSGPRVEGLKDLERAQSRTGAAPYSRAASRVDGPIPDAQHGKDTATLAEALFFSHVTRVLDRQGTKAVVNDEAMGLRQHGILTQMIANDVLGRGPLGQDRPALARLTQLLQQIRGPEFFMGDHAQVRERVHGMMMKNPAFRELARNEQVSDLTDRKVVQGLTNSRQAPILQVLRGADRQAIHVVDRGELRALSAHNVKARNVTYSTQAKVLCQRAFDEAQSRRAEVDRMRAGPSGSWKAPRAVVLEKASKQSFNAATEQGLFTPAGLR